MDYILENDKIEFNINEQIYAKRTIMQVAYQFIDDYYIYLDYVIENPQYIKVVLEPKKEAQTDLKQAAGEFQNELLNQNLRACIEEKTKSVRELVLARALFSTYLDESEEKQEKQEKTDAEYSVESIAKDWFDGQ